MRFLFLIGTVVGHLLTVQAQPPLPDLSMTKIAAQLGFRFYRSVPSQTTVRVAILDNGFRGWRREIGRTLPKNTVYHPGPVKVDPRGEDPHGLFMARIVSGLLEQAPEIDYRLHLFSAFGYSNLKAAVQAIRRGSFDVVLYSQVWEYGGNGDGRGFINRLIEPALNSGAIWINASGNFARGTYMAMIRSENDGWLSMPGPNRGARVRCAPSRAQSRDRGQDGDRDRGHRKGCLLRAVLAWNDFKDDVDAGTDKDLDLILTDDTLKIIASSGLKQVLSTRNQRDQPGLSLYPREIINTEIEPGTYFLRVKDRSRNFDRHDQLRLTVSGDDVELIDSVRGETVLPPADHPDVITVGAFDSDRSSFARRSGKPELLAPSEVVLKNGKKFLGSSNAAAFTAAAAVVLKGVDPRSDRDEILRRLSAWGQPGSPIPYMRLPPPAPGY